MRAILETIAPELGEMDEGTREELMRDIRAIYREGRFGPEELHVRAGGGVSVAGEISEGGETRDLDEAATSVATKLAFESVSTASWEGSRYRSFRAYRN